MNDWLPEHQRHLLHTLAHVDSVIDQLGNVRYDFLETGPLGFENRVADGREDVLIRAILPIPETVPRLASDALNQMRSAVEHALFAGVEAPDPTKTGWPTAVMREVKRNNLPF